MNFTIEKNSCMGRNLIKINPNAPERIFKKIPKPVFGIKINIV